MPQWLYGREPETALLHAFTVALPLRPCATGSPVSLAS